MTWDDHEFKDNYADLDLEPDQPLETVAARRAAAYLAYWEHAPLPRARKPVGKDMPLYRRAAWGDLATFHVLDTRQYRSDQIEACTRPARARRRLLPGALLDTPRHPRRRRSATGCSRASPARAALERGRQPGRLRAAGRATPTRPGATASTAGTGTSPTASACSTSSPSTSSRNTVVITGDAHEHSVRNVPPSFRSLDGTPVATEFLGTSITSEGQTAFGTTFGGERNNPHRLFNDHHRGYVLVTLDPAEWSAEFRGLADVRKADTSATTIARFVVENGKPGGVRDGV